MTTLAIAEAKIKLAWREKYLTDGSNERGLSSPRGAYRGYWLSPRLAPDTWLRLIIDPYTPGHAVDKDQFAVISDRTTGFSLSVRETTDIEFNCVDLFPVVGATEDWYVYIEATYTPNAVTTANYRVSKTDPHLVDPTAVILGVVPMTLGDMAINFVVMPPPAGMYDRRCIPSPTARQLVADYVDGDEPWGLFDGLSKWCLGTGAEARAFAEPTITSHALVVATKFQLSGTYYVGRDVAGTAGKYFRFMDTTVQYNSPLVGSDGGRIVCSTVVYLSDGVTAINPGADSDTEGFYANPWLALNFADTVDVSYTGTLRVLGYSKQTLLTMANNPAGAFPIGDIEQAGHARWILGKAVAGTPEALSAGLLSTQIASMLGDINDRIETIHPTAAPGTWVLLWRSHGIVVDANVTKQTSSLYFGDKGLALLHGGYIKIADGDVYAGTGAAGDDVSILYLRSGGSGGLTFGVKSGPVSPAHWDVETGWSMYTDYSTSQMAMQSTGGPIAPWGGIRWLPGWAADYLNSIAAGNDYALYEQTESVSAAVPRMRKYYQQHGMEYAYNCSYDFATGDWSADKTGFSAFVYRMDAFGMTLYRKQEILAIPTTWADVGGWDTYWILGSEYGTHNDGLACFSIGGLLMETVRFGWIGNAAGVTSKFGCVCNFRNRWASAPVVGDMTIAVNENDIGGVGTFTVTTGDIFDIDNWGFRVMVDKNVADGLYYTYDASLTIEVT